MSQWFLDPLNKKGPDFIRNKNRILDKSDFMEANFMTTSPDVLSFLSKKLEIILYQIHQIVLLKP